MKATQNTKALKGVALILSALVYVGAVAYGDIMFLQIMADTFPDGFMGTLAMVGAVMTAVSAITLPLALHFWFTPGLQFIWGVAFWFLDVLVLALNSMLAYQYSTGVVDPTLGLWGEFSPATPLLAVFGWGIAYLLDSSHRERHSELELQAELAETRRQQRLEAARSDDVFDIVKRGAIEDARNEASAKTGKHPTEFLPAPNGRHPVQTYASDTKNHYDGNPTLPPTS
jgi:hypothetical protein